jgi:hypothetical protein
VVWVPRPRLPVSAGPATPVPYAAASLSRCRAAALRAWPAVSSAARGQPAQASFSSVFEAGPALPSASDAALFPPQGVFRPPARLGAGAPDAHRVRRRARPGGAGPTRGRRARGVPPHEGRVRGQERQHAAPAVPRAHRADRARRGAGRGGPRRHRPRGLRAERHRRAHPGGARRAHAAAAGLARAPHQGPPGRALARRRAGPTATRWTWPSPPWPATRPSGAATP